VPMLCHIVFVLFFFVGLFDLFDSASELHFFSL
jgi:hypothetical protein